MEFIKILFKAWRECLSPMKSKMSYINMNCVKVDIVIYKGCLKRAQQYRQSRLRWMHCQGEGLYVCLCVCRTTRRRCVYRRAVKYLCLFLALLSSLYLNKCFLSKNPRRVKEAEIATRAAAFTRFDLQMHRACIFLQLLMKSDPACGLQTVCPGGELLN